MGTKHYVNCSLVERPYLFKGYYEEYSIEESILTKLAKELGISYDMYVTLSNMDDTVANNLISSMSKRNNHTDITLLLDDDNKSVIGYSLESPRVPILNTDFIKRVESMVESSSEVEIKEKYHASDDTLASVIIKKVEPITVDIDGHPASYEIGVLVLNNELDSASCRLVAYLDDQPIYLPASYYNVTTNRYKKSTGNSSEALEVLVLKIIDDLREEEMNYKMQEFHSKFKVNKEILTTYEEYNTLLRSMMKIPSIAEDRSFLESLSMKYDDFEKKYTHLDSQKSSYIWRCTAMGDLTIGSLVHITSIILNELGAPAMEYYNVRDLLGNYLSTSRIAVEIAREDI